MFICSECGTKYKIMPKFCDCGNDIFIEEQEPQAPIQDIDILQEQSPRRKGRGKVESFSPVAIGAFALCIILSLVILFFIGNPQKEIPAENNADNQNEQITDIPAIDSFWNNTPPKSAPNEEEKIAQESKEQPIMDIVPKFVQNILPQETKKTQAPITVKTNPAKSVNTVKQVKTQKQTTKPVQSTATKPTQTQQINSQAQAITNRIKNNMQQNNTPKPQNTIPQQPVQAPQPTQTTKTPPATQITQTTQPAIKTNKTQTTVQTQAPTPTVKTKSQAELIKELNTYKASLRNTIGRKIDFTKVIGDGDCALTFKINSSGRLISKAFTKQSSNITLNDAVFSAMSSITSYNPPPEGYKGEKLNLKIRFYNGNFEITLY